MVAANKYQARHHQFTGRKAWQGRQSPQAKLIAAYEHKIEYLQQEIEQKDKRMGAIPKSVILSGAIFPTV